MGHSRPRAHRAEPIVCRIHDDKTACPSGIAASGRRFRLNFDRPSEPTASRNFQRADARSVEKFPLFQLAHVRGDVGILGDDVIDLVVEVVRVLLQGLQIEIKAKNGAQLGQ